MSLFNQFQKQFCVILVFLLRECQDPMVQKDKPVVPELKVQLAMTD